MYSPRVVADQKKKKKWGRQWRNHSLPFSCREPIQEWEESAPRAKPEPTRTPRSSGKVPSMKREVHGSSGTKNRKPVSPKKGEKTIPLCTTPRKSTLQKGCVLIREGIWKSHALSLSAKEGTNSNGFRGTGIKDGKCNDRLQGAW